LVNSPDLTFIGVAVKLVIVGGNGGVIVDVEVCWSGGAMTVCVCVCVGICDGVETVGICAGTGAGVCWFGGAMTVCVCVGIPVGVGITGICVFVDVEVCVGGVTDATGVDVEN